MKHSVDNEEKEESLRRHVEVGRVCGGRLWVENELAGCLGKREGEDVCRLVFLSVGQVDLVGFLWGDNGDGEIIVLAKDGVLELHKRHALCQRALWCVCDGTSSVHWVRENRLRVLGALSTFRA